MFEIINEYSKKLDLDNFSDYTNFLVKELSLNNCYFNIIFVDNDYIQKLNKQYRGIDKVTDVRYAASLKAGGAGIRYTCQISGKERYLFLEDQRWFVDAK